MKKLCLALALALFCSAAFAQSGEVANHAVPIGKGPGVSGFGAAVPGASGTVLTSTGASTDPTFQSLPSAPTLTNHGVVLGTGAPGFNATSAGTATQVLTSNGAAADPTFQAIPAGPGFATVPQYFAGTSSTTIIPPSIIYPTEVTVTFGTTTTFDFSTFINAAVTLTGNITTMTLSNVTAGKSGMIVFIQDGSGSRTTVWNTIFKFSGSLPTLSTAPGAIDALQYDCRSATFCVASLLTNVHNP